MNAINNHSSSEDLLHDALHKDRASIPVLPSQPSERLVQMLEQTSTPSPITGPITGSGFSLRTYLFSALLIGTGIGAYFTFQKEVPEQIPVPSTVQQQTPIVASDNKPSIKSEEKKSGKLAAESSSTQKQPNGKNSEAIQLNVASFDSILNQKSNKAPTIYSKDSVQMRVRNN